MDFTDRIIFEDDALLVVNKPPGVVVHSDGRGEAPALTDWLAKERPALVGVGETLTLQNGETITRPGIVHRIDRDTSGVLVVAKTPEAHAALKAQFQNRTIKKEYRAFVWGAFKEMANTIDLPIGRSRNDFRRFSALRDAKGTLREAVTSYHVLEQSREHAYVAVQPKTGRTHQIRVHFRAINHPLVCDGVYAPKWLPALGFERLALHAFTITLTHPESGEMVRFEAPLPEDFEEGLKALAAAEQADTQ